ncbi:hypothetical protein GLAREA_09978 [Glarea lozoyensis ATCC 20868]|uniref:Rhodopsin domain-containing protein n=1 Tax=Glarea lozoyensis (strain ATCC 20868 / MF5171) TaxID=1116229 RepID=S3DB30_GLAL2|nr:uncharacterized protein GLAREA_09978 [Glarea lozoyensis ATCC 20868]EPE34284.1 hypothetical protein GLAREA_09978 [Glarea lozoyensis ATCC 20868]
MWHVAGMPIVERNYALVVNTFFWTILAMIFIAMRLFTRAYIVKRVGIDDYLMVCAMAFSIAYTVTVFIQIRWGLGQPVNLATLQQFLAALFSTVPLYNFTQTFYKLSMLTQSYRLFTTVMGQRIIKFLIAWIIVCGIMSVCGSIFYCFPVAKAWNFSLEGFCFNRPALNYSISGFNIVNDLILVAIPTPFLMKLQLPKKQRIVLISVFACGAIVTVVSVIRLKALYTNLNGPEELQPVTGVDIALWSGLEINMAIICGSVPALKAFVSRVILRNTHLSSSGGREGYGKSSTHGRQFPRSKLDSQTADAFDDGGERGPMEIMVQRDIELKHFKVADDDGSESDLIIQNNQVLNNFSKPNLEGVMVNGKGNDNASLK